jgi:hypothetical protein
MKQLLLKITIASLGLCETVSTCRERLRNDCLQVLFIFGLFQPHNHHQTFKLVTETITIVCITKDSLRRLVFKS